MTKEQKQRIVEAYLRLGTYEKVRVEAGCGTTTICKVIKEYGYSKGKGGNQPYKATDAQITELVEAGLTRHEIADTLGIHVENLARRLKKLGLSANKVDKNGKSVYSRTSQEVNAKLWHYSPGADAIVKEKCGDRFEFIGYKQHKIKMRCRKCGSIVERTASGVKRYNTVCEVCQENERESQRLADERKRLLCVLTALVESKTPKKCAVCGAEFYSQYNNQLYCSSKCRQKNKNRRNSSIRHRCKKYGVYYDASVTPRKIFARDKYICKICGLVCNKEDDTWNGYIGPYYPTVDHIVALANGGTHTWDNVQCAHAICNSYKRDLITV